MDRGVLSSLVLVDGSQNLNYLREEASGININSFSSSHEAQLSLNIELLMYTACGSEARVGGRTQESPSVFQC